MKKKYQKPELFYECFDLQRSIASTCDVNTTAMDNSCTFHANGLVFFSTDNQACFFTPQDGNDSCTMSTPSSGLVLVGS